MSLGTQAEYYQLVLAATYHADGLWGESTFELYARHLPAGQGYYVVAGLEPLVEQLLSLRFTEEEVQALRTDPTFRRVDESFFESLLRFRFEGAIDAVAEGTPMFPGEPVLRITAPLIVNTLIETRTIQTVATSTAVATRASRLVEAAEGRPVLDFSSRRTAGPEAAFQVSRSAWIGGVAATTNARAALALGITPMGTMSDTFLAAYGDESTALDAYRLHFPDLCHLTLQDDDPVAGLARYRRFAAEVHTVRVDHEDLAGMSRAVRAELDRLGMGHTRILGSGQLDEHAVRELVRGGAPIQLFAVGRALAAAEGGGLRFAFRIAERQVGTSMIPVRHSGGAFAPGPKQVARGAAGDLVLLDHETLPPGTEALLQPVVRGGARLRPLPTATEARTRRAAAVAALPAEVRDLVRPSRWPVRHSDALRAPEDPDAVTAGRLSSRPARSP